MNHKHHKEKIEDAEITSWKKKLFGSWILTIPIAIIMLSERIFNFPLIEMPYSIITILVIGFPVIFVFGWDTIKGGMRGLFTFYFNMDSLISLGTVVAYLTGIFYFTGFVQDYSGVAAMIMAFFTTGKYVEAKARGRASQEIKKLLELGAKKARILRANKEIEIPIEEVKISPILTSSIGISISLLALRILAFLAPNSSNFFISCEALPLAFASTYFPVVKNAIIIAATPE